MIKNRYMENGRKMTKHEICEHIIYYGRCSNISCTGKDKWCRNYGTRCPLYKKKYDCRKDMIGQAQRWLDDHPEKPKKNPG